MTEEEIGRIARYVETRERMRAALHDPSVSFYAYSRINHEHVLLWCGMSGEERAAAAFFMESVSLLKGAQP